MQNNCVDGYIYDHAEEETIILFLRKTEAPDKPFVTMEISTNYEVCQVFAKNNTLPRKDVWLFIEEYCKVKKIDYDPEYLIGEKLSSCDHAGELRKYLEKFTK